VTAVAAFASRWAERLGPHRWRPSAPLAPFTTFHVGGPADWLAQIQSVDELEALAADASHSGIPISLLGGGSNVLVADAGVPGVVVRLQLTAIDRPSPDTVRAEAGVTINGLVRWTIGRGLAGLEAWAGTPGTVGGAVYGNAHWGGRNIGDLVTTARLMTRGGQSATVAGTDLGFAYDTSRLQETGEILIWADFRVSPGEPAALRAQARTSLHYRKTTQPLATPSAGCVFQNPGSGDLVPAGIPRSAGALIDRAGLKGRRLGGARISDHHANFIVNDGGATAADIRTLIEMARTAVRERFGVALRDEVVYLGNFEV
jgi:UDP-N-acetylmuramate dehydrogenase